MRLISREIDKRQVNILDRSIKLAGAGVDGIMTFGLMNDYPQVIERIVFGSVSAKSCRDIYARFLIGQGFENEAINDIVVGINNGNEVTIVSLLTDICKSIALNSGAYIHLNKNLENISNCAKIVPFKFCRYGKVDDKGFYANIAVHPNWSKDNQILNSKNSAFKPTDVNWYPRNSRDLKILQDQIKHAGGIEKFKGVIHIISLDNEYLYPLSPFDPVYLDCDTDQQVSIYKNNQTRNGFTKKTIMRVAAGRDEAQSAEFDNVVRGWTGVEGDNILVIEDEIDEVGNIKENGAFKIDQIDSQIDDKLFETWQKEISNNIRKAVRNLPAILIDYEDNKLGSTSGEAIVQATNFYNAMTLNDRKEISKTFKEIFTNFDNPILNENTNWEIKPLNLYNYGTANI